jgi:hypothetical protein
MLAPAILSAGSAAGLVAGSAGDLVAGVVHPRSPGRRCLLSAA